MKDIPLQSLIADTMLEPLPKRKDVSSRDLYNINNILQ